MLTRLRNLRVREGSFVPAGDNPRAHILFLKSEKTQMDVAAIIALLKGLKPEALAEVITGAGVPDAGTIQKALDEEKAKTEGLQKALDEATKAPDPVVDAVAKAAQADPVIAAEFAKRDQRIAELEKQAKDRAEAAERATCLEIAKGYSVGIEDEKLAEVLRVSKGALAPDQFGEFCRVLKSCTEIRKTALGADGSGTPVDAGNASDAAQAFAKLDAAAKQIASAEKITYAKAFAKACRDNPTLYATSTKGA
jgi:hypothetical protein